MILTDKKGNYLVEPNTVIWRYQDLAKFLLMIVGDAQYSLLPYLYFSKQSFQGDQLEGDFPVEAWEETGEKILLAKGTTINDFHEYFRDTKKDTTFISCWNMAESESAALWGLYTPKNSPSIAIKSTVQRLNDCIIEYNTLKIGPIKYYSDLSDIDSYEAINGNFGPAFYKAMPYKYESELRAVIGGLPDQFGLKVHCNLSTLFDEIYLSPAGSRQYYVDLIETLLAEKGLADVPVRMSQIQDKFLFP